MRTYTELREDYLNYLKSNPLVGSPDELYDPANYILDLGGKRIRPVLVLLGYQFKRSDVEKALPLAHAVELFHNFTLMHDDIMDRADVRRGKPTVHKKWNENIAILSGDMMLVRAYRSINQLDAPSEIKCLIMDEFSKMAEEVCVGQQFDMNFETRDEVAEQEYLHMIEGKTSVLLAFSLMSGSVLAGATDEEARMLYDYGLNVGLAFQVMDDYLDTFGTQENFGKRIGGDILENKKTLLAIEAFKRAKANQKAALDSWYAQSIDSQDKIDSVTQIFKDLGIPDYAKSVMGGYMTKAHELSEVLSKTGSMEALNALTADLNQRNT